MKTRPKKLWLKKLSDLLLQLVRVRLKLAFRTDPALLLKSWNMVLLLRMKKRKNLLENKHHLNHQSHLNINLMEWFPTQSQLSKHQENSPNLKLNLPYWTIYHSRVFLKWQLLEVLRGKSKRNQSQVERIHPVFRRIDAWISYPQWISAFYISVSVIPLIINKKNQSWKTSIAPWKLTLILQKLTSGKNVRKTLNWQDRSQNLRKLWIITRRDSMKMIQVMKDQNINCDWCEKRLKRVRSLERSKEMS